MVSGKLKLSSLDFKNSCLCLLPFYKLAAGVPTSQIYGVHFFIGG